MNPIGNHVNPALSAARGLRSSADATASSLEKLATGQRLNRGSDDPSGLITSENLRAVLAALDAEVRSLQRVDQVANTADGALGSVSGLINRAEELIIANASTTGMSDAELEANQLELDSIISSIDRTAGSAQFNGHTLFDGSMTLSASGESIALDTVDAASLGEVEVDGANYSMADLKAGMDLNIVNGDLAEAQETVRAARSQISALRGRIGSFQTHTISARLNDLSVTIENIASAESQVRDTDYARELATLSRAAVLNESATDALGLVNSRTKNVLNLLG